MLKEFLYGVKWFLVYLAIYLTANFILFNTTFYAIPFWEVYLSKEWLAVFSLFVASLLISIFCPLLALIIPLFLFYYATLPFSNMLVNSLTYVGYHPALALVIASLSWYPAVMDVFLAWGFGLFIGSIIGIKSFPRLHQIYGKVYRKWAG